MIKNFFISALRNFWKQKFSSIINIIGLTIALTCCMFILLFVFDELRYDKYHTDKERIVRLITEYKPTGERDAIFPAVKFQKYLSVLPEFEKGFRLSRHQKQAVSVGEQMFVDDVYFADNEILQIMTFPLIRGDKKNALSEPFSAVLTESLAKKYFGKENPVGKTMRVANQFDLKITGILKEIPAHSHIKPSIIASILSYNTLSPMLMEDDRMSNFYFYFKLGKNVSVETAEEKLNMLLAEQEKNKVTGEIKFILESLPEIYLYSTDTKWDIAEHGDINVVKSFIAITFMIMLMAAFNYTNLLTTLVKIREKELSIRKLLGAGRKNILFQFSIETLFYMLFSLIVAIELVSLLIPYFNELTAKDLQLSSLLNYYVIVSISAIIIFSTVLSVIYPFVIAFRSDAIYRIKGSIPSLDIRISKFSIGFRQIVTGIQFVITIGLIIAAIVIYKQMSYMMNARLGFNKEQLLIVENPYDEKMFERYENFKNRVSKYPQVLSVSASTNVPGENINNYNDPWIAGKTQNESVHVGLIAVDYDLLKTWQVKFLEGRDFSRDFASDAENGIILNKAAADAFGLKSAVGAQFNGVNNANWPQTVIGVIENIHLKSFKEKVMPIIFYVRPWSAVNIVVKLNTQNLTETVELLKDEWNAVMPDQPFMFTFADEAFNSLYDSEQRTSKLVMIFCALAILLSSIGLLSLITLSSQMRKKEIGIHKVLGASIPEIFKLVIREYLLIIITANIIAVPLAYYFMNQWLEKFAYRIQIDLFTFIMAGALALFIGVSVVSYHILKASMMNPVDSLKCE